MTTSLVINSATDVDELMELAVYDTGFAVGTVEPGAPRGRGFTGLLAQMLLACGRAQPSNTPTRSVTRADIGRVTVAARAARRDLVVLGSERLCVPDVNLLRLAAHRAGVDLWLVADRSWPPDVTHWAHKHAEHLRAAEVITLWGQRPTAQQRHSAWPCDASLQTGTSDHVNCTRHRDPVGCVLEWFPHAFVTARTTPVQIRTCLFELTVLYPEWKWRVWARARDHYPGLMRAAATWNVNSSELASAPMSALDSTATTLTLESGIFPIPETQRDLVAAHRDVRMADGFTPADLLFQVSAAHASQYMMLRPGDLRPQAA